MYTKLNKAFFIFVSLLVSTQFSFAQDSSPTPYKLPIQVIETENFRALTHLIEEKMGPEYSAIRKKLDLQLLVNDPYKITMKAEADLQGRTAIVRLFGGIPRHPDMTLDGLAMIICHEIGHHLAGEPKRSAPWKWSSVEGQSDYYSGNVCLKKVWESQNHALYIPEQLHPFIVERCHAATVAPGDFALCARGLMAAQSMTDVLKSMRRLSRKVDFDEIPPTPSVNSTYTDHPSIACRFKTLIAGVVNEDRPRCWFKP